MASSSNNDKMKFFAEMFVFVTILLFKPTFCFIQPGVFEEELSTAMIVSTEKIWYNGTELSVTATCVTDGKNADSISYNIQWALIQLPCLHQTDLGSDIFRNVLDAQDESLQQLTDFVSYERSQEMMNFCSESDNERFTLPEGTGMKGRIPLPEPKEIPASPDSKKNEDDGTKKTETDDEKKSRKKRDDSDSDDPVGEQPQPQGGEKAEDNTGDEGEDDSATESPPPSSTTDVDDMSTSPTTPHGVKAGGLGPHSKPATDNYKITTWTTGIYVLMIRMKSETNFTLSLRIEAKGPGGYLVPSDWPLLPFYITMCVIYIIYGIAWLVMSAMNWRDLLRIQFWIGGVIFLGMLEKGVFLAEYESINNTGESVAGALVFAELVSSMKKTLSRMLIIIVSLGYGIIKPRLGPQQQRVVGIGILFFILSAIEGCLRALSPKSAREVFLASIPLAVVDAAICWWVFTSLVQTTRTLRLRRNVVKLTLYRHFTNTLIFAVLASVAFMIWSVKTFRFDPCISDWKELWVDEAFWHLLFCVVLMIIMILWRPSANNQRYAFSPLMQSEEEAAEEPMLNDAFDGMSMRGNKPESPSSGRQSVNKAEDDLKWIEENIPSSVGETALPSLLDSDEEVETTKYEISKME